MLRSIATLWPYFRQQRWRLIAIACMSAVFSAVTVLQPWPLKLLIDHALGDGGVADEQQRIAIIWTAGAATIGLFLLNALLDVAVSWAWMASGQRMVYDLTVDVFERLLHSSALSQRRSVGDSLERLSGDTWCVYTVASDLLIAPIQHSLTLFGIVIVAWQLDPRLTVVSLMTAPIVAGSVIWFGPKLKRRAKQGRELRSDLTSFVHQTVTSMPLVQAFGAESRNQAYFESLVDNVVSITQRGVLVSKSFSLLNGVAASAASAIVLLVGGLQALQGSITIGSLLVFMAYVRTMQSACESLLKIYAKVKTSEASIERLSEILGEPEHTPIVGGAVALPPLTQFGSSVRFENVTVAYAGGKAALENVSFEIAAGEKVAVVGESGAGKSTLIALILRLVDADQGIVSFDGTNVRKLDLDDLRSRIAVVLQDPFLVRATIADNIAVGKRDASGTEILAAAELAGAREFIDRLPDGFDTMIGERGSTLSGGQRQRIAIARAFVRQASLVILDEPTAALDAATEIELMESFKRLTSGRTSIIVSHRLSTIRDADRILVLNKGSLVESGNLTKLLALRGHFYRLHQAAHHGVIGQEAVA